MIVTSWMVVVVSGGSSAIDKTVVVCLVRHTIALHTSRHTAF